MTDVGLRLQAGGMAGGVRSGRSGCLSSEQRQNTNQTLNFLLKQVKEVVFRCPVKLLKRKEEMF